MPRAGSCGQAVACWRRNLTFHLKSASRLHGCECGRLKPRRQIKTPNIFFPCCYYYLGGGWEGASWFLNFQVRCYWVAELRKVVTLGHFLHPLMPTFLCAELLCPWDGPKPIPFMNRTSGVFYSQQRDRHLHIPWTTWNTSSGGTSPT